MGLRECPVCIIFLNLHNPLNYHICTEMDVRLTDHLCGHIVYVWMCVYVLYCIYLCLAQY